MFTKTLKVMMIINVNINACTEMSLHYLVMGLRAGYPKLSLWHVDDFKLKRSRLKRLRRDFYLLSPFIS